MSSSSQKPCENPIPTQFFKVMVPDFRTRLRLPPSFCKHLSRERSKIAIVTSPKGSWRVNVCKSSNNQQISFEKGWDKFVKDHNLQIADFLIFQHLGNMSFQVEVFEFSTSCIKELPATEERRKLSDSHDSVKVDDSSETPSPYFSVTLKPSHVRRRPSPTLTIPVGFWRSHDHLSSQESVLLRGPSSIEPQKVRVRLMLNKRPGRRCPQLKMVSAGWREFIKLYKLKVGDVCRFKINGITNESIVIFDVEINPQ